MPSASSLPWSSLLLQCSDAYGNLRPAIAAIASGLQLELDRAAFLERERWQEWRDDCRVQLKTLISFFQILTTLQVHTQLAR